MLQNYVLALLFLAVTGVLILVVRFVTKITRPQISDREKAISHEFEIDPRINRAQTDSDETALGDYSNRYYILAAVAVVLLVQAIFLVPWAVKAKALGVFGVVEMLVFLGVVIIGYAWLWKKGAIE